MPLEENRDYLVSLGTGAQDRNGLSLERKFEASFTTRPPGERLTIVSLEPEHNGTISQSRESVKLLFSSSVTVNSCISHISFSPSVNGSWRLDDSGKAAIFTPLEPWKHGCEYRIDAAPAFEDAKGRRLGDDFSSFFTAATDGDLDNPKLLAAWAVNPDSATEIKSGEEFDGWESFTGLRLDFSKPVDALSVKTRVSTEPNAALLMETPHGLADSVFLRFAETPAWDERFLFRIQSGVRDDSGNESAGENIFTVRTNGTLSKPPVLIGIRLPMAPGNKDTEKLEPVSFSPSDLFENLPIDAEEDRYPYDAEVKTWIELYFDTANKTAMDLMQVMDLFRVEATNGAIIFSPRLVSDTNFTMPVPEQKWASYKRIEIQGLMTNTVNSGVVSFLIPQGLKDARGNRNSKASRISLLK